MKLLWPVSSDYPITQTFAEHVHAARLNGWTNYNGGQDSACPTGTPVKVAADGGITGAGNDPDGYGRYVKVKHSDGYETIYAHLADFTVNVGQKVTAGQVIGHSDNTGNSTGPHLHFEVRLNGEPVDPALLLVAVEPETVEIGAAGALHAGWNLRTEPEGRTIATTYYSGQVQVIERRGDWVQVGLWVHRDAVE